MQRRSFLKRVSGVVGAGALGVGRVTASQEVAVQTAKTAVSEMPRRVLGRTGQRISIVGFPGLSLIHGDQPACTKALRDAFDRGVNYFDVAPAYGDAEVKMGLGLEGIDRSRIFLACKTKMRDRAGARKELEQSLKRLKTDHFDLYQLHALIKPEEVEQALAPGGAVETLSKAREEGKVRYFGFSAHTTKAAVKALNGFRFDTVMFPINFIELLTLGFGKAVLELAHKQGAGVLAIKPMCRGNWPKGVERTRRWWYRPVEDEREIDLALRFTLSQTPVVAGLPPGFLDLLDKAITVGHSYRPITEEETARLRELAQKCESTFRAQEQGVASAAPARQHPLYPDSPHECCPCAIS